MFIGNLPQAANAKIDSNIHFRASLARHPKNDRARIHRQRITTIDKNLFSQNINVIARPMHIADTCSIVVSDPNRISIHHRRTAAHLTRHQPLA